MIKPLKLTKLEHNTEKKIMTAINDLGGYVIKNQASSTTGRGRPDLSACIKGKYYAIEVKRESNVVETTSYQLAVLISIAKAGGMAFYSKTEQMFDLKQYHVKTIHQKPQLTVKKVKDYLNQSQIKVIRITNAQTMKLYFRKE